MRKTLLVAILPLFLLAACKDREAMLYPDQGELFVQLERKSVDQEFTGERIRCVVTGEYPQISGHHNEKIQRRINAELEDRTVEHSRADAEQCVEDLSDLLIAEDELVSTANVEFRLHTNERGVLSLSYLTSTYMEGAAHPNNDVTGMTIDLRTGEFYELQDLFVDSYDIEAELTNRLLDMREAEGLDARSVNEMRTDEPAWYVTPDALTFINLFDVHALRGLRVKIPLSELEEVAAPTGPIAALSGQ